jgi:hypothetical protein
MGRFTEVGKRRDDDRVEQVHGCLVEVWHLEADGEWRLSVLFTSRYAEDKRLGKEEMGKAEDRMQSS